ncbi:5'_nucleotidase family protein [Hexamita inflata]|uniref:5' nucleotidase family protein n=1 Tax=Hexamita inflata TaxID=28002 RepID=A0AA86VBT0_9EUKA|nr:5' nucleotidase family protein [Hexamita inflata]
MDNMHKAIFINKPLDFGRIKAVGFSIDHSIVQYTEKFYELIHTLIIELLIEKYSYPDTIRELKYIHNLHAAVAAVDKTTGCALQVDEFGNIICCIQGFLPLTKPQFTQIYPDRAVRLEQSRYFVPEVSFHQILIQLYCQIVHQFIITYQQTSDPLVKQCQNPQPYIPTTSPTKGRLDFMSLFADVSAVYQLIMTKRKILSQRAFENPSQYFKQSVNLKQTLQKLALSKKLFVLTDLDYDYVNGVLKFVIGEDYLTYFDQIIVSRSMNQFFNDKKPFRKYFDNERVIGLGATSMLERNQIYYNGNIFDFEEQSGVKAKNTLYVSDQFMHNEEIYNGGLWHFCQVCPQLEQEFQVIKKNTNLLSQVQKLRNQQRTIMSHHTSYDIDPPEELLAQRGLKDAAAMELQQQFGPFGSSFFTFWSLTYFGAKLRRSCDIYCVTGLAFKYYASFYMFAVQAQNRFLPHQMIEMKMDEMTEAGGEEKVVDSETE